MPTDATVSGETFQDAEFRIDKPNSAYGNSPYTEQTTDCGVPGDYTHITPTFILNGTGFGDKGKTLLHEFSKLRWGVFEEHGYPGDDMFPMFYLKETWGANGQETVVKPNFCVNGDLKGYEQDIVSNGACKKDANGLPNDNCVFFATQDSAVTSSLMALPYLSANINFCDDESETYIHLSDIPTKQNLYCNGRSTWNVISESNDFKNSNNSPVNISNTDPKYIIIGGEEQIVKYVMVMDVSRSMDPNINPEHADRLTAMKDAAKRFVNFDIPDGTVLGMLPFSTDQYPNLGFYMTAVNQGVRETMVQKIDGLKIQSGTCITDGLFRAVQDPNYLNNAEGNAIILLTDGQQDGACNTNYDQIRDYLVKMKVRLITIALGNSADQEIEGLAEATGGKSFFVDDNSGPGDFSDAFTGSTTFQPADTISNTDMTLYQNDFVYSATIHEAFDVDVSVGKNFTLRVEIANGNKDCNQNMNISLIGPNISDRKDFTFRCSKQNFGTFVHQLDEEATAGRWQFFIKSTESFDSISVRVTSRSRNANDDPIQTKCWIKTGEQQLGTDVYLKLSAVAEVKKGNMPVLGAKVRAYITRPSDGGENPPLEMELEDNGSGADVIRNDGIYSRYFTKYTGVGRYSVKCEVVGNDDTEINEGFIISRSLPERPGVPICCGSNAVSPNSKLTKSGNFTRQAVGGSFQAKPGDLPFGDMSPPSRVTDLKLENDCGNVLLMFTSPGDDYDSPDKVKEYTIKYSKFASNLTEIAFDDPEISVIKGEDIIDGTLTPVNGGTPVKLQLQPTLFEDGITYSFVMRSVDESNNKSPLSVIAKMNAGDYCPPAAVSDLQIRNSCENPQLTFTSPGNNDNSADKVTKYIIKYAPNLSQENFEDSEIPELKQEDLLGDSTLSPVNGGELVKLELKPSLFANGIVYRFAMVAVDDADNKSPLSGLSNLRDVCPPSKVDDLEVSLACDNVTIVFTSPGDDGDKEAPVLNYTIKYSQDWNIIDDFEDPNLNELSADDLIQGDTLDPVNGGELVLLTIKASLLKFETNYTFAMVSSDESGNTSPVSNIASDMSCKASPNSSGKIIVSVVLIFVCAIFISVI